MKSPFLQQSTAGQMITLVKDVAGDEIAHPLDLEICAIVGQELCKHYPGWEWLVDADHRKGMLDIRNQSLSGSMGVRVKMSGHATASELMKIAMQSGGEILERYNMPRGGINQELIDLAPTKFDGELVFCR